LSSLEAQSQAPPARIPIEFAPGALAAALAVACVMRYDADAHGFISGVATAVLVVLAATDIRERLIPNRIVIPAAGIVLLAQVLCYPSRTAEWVIASLGAALFLFAPTVVKRGAIGMGDVKLGLLIGAALGSSVLSGLTIGFLAVAPFALYKLAREGAEARKSYLPLGPFLAFGAIVVLLSGGAA